MSGETSSWQDAPAAAWARAKSFFNSRRRVMVIIGQLRFQTGPIQTKNSNSRYSGTSGARPNNERTRAPKSGHVQNTLVFLQIGNSRAKQRNTVIKFAHAAITLHTK